jgi:hypothetical protein
LCCSGHLSGKCNRNRLIQQPSSFDILIGMISEFIMRLSERTRKRTGHYLLGAARDQQMWTDTVTLGYRLKTKKEKHRKKLEILGGKFEKEEKQLK